MFLSNKYSKIYNALIEKRRLEIPSGYTEKHHVIPKSLGGDNTRENIVPLTAREHFIAHALLFRMTIGKAKSKMAQAICMMKGKGSRQRAYSNSRIFETARIHFSESCKGRIWSDASRQKLANSHRGLKRPPRTEEWKAKQRESHLGRKDTEAAFIKKSAAHRGQNNPRAKIWKLEREDGTHFEIKSLKTWCKENHINEHYLKTRQTFTSGVRLAR